MRKFALLLAATLLVAAPLAAINSTDTYAAAAKAKKASGKGGAESAGDPNTAFWRALGRSRRPVRPAEHRRAEGRKGDEGKDPPGREKICQDKSA